MLLLNKTAHPQPRTNKKQVFLLFCPQTHFSGNIYNIWAFIENDYIYLVLAVETFVSSASPMIYDNTCRFISFIITSLNSFYMIDFTITAHILP